MAVSRVAPIASALVVFSALAVQPAAAQWAPPIGIPAPSFGITNVARAVPNPWTVSTAGFYYVEPTKAASTDVSNPYGTPAKPRKTIPTALPAGAVVEVHGTYDASHSSPATIVASGTASAPVFIRGVSATSRPLARRGWEVRGSYLIVENIEFGPLADQSDTGSIVILLPADHVAVRHSDIHGLPSGGGVGIVNWEVPYGVIYTGSGYLDNIVLWDNLIHDNGDLNATYDQDVHGISVSDHVRYLWVVDNQIYRNSGDGIQVNAQAPSAATTHHIYIGRNVSHHNKQTGFWVKSSTDVIVSQNESYGHRPSNSSLGQCMGGQYGPDWVWFLYNHSHDCEYGITQMSDNQEQSHWFLIGNIIENIHRSQASDPSDSWGPSAIMMSGGYERHLINNTIYNTDSGVNISSPVGTLEIADNIISTITQPAASHVLLGFAQIAANTVFHHNLLFGDPRLDWANGQFRPTAAQLTLAQSLSTDPQFVNPAGGDFHIPSTSPANGTAEFSATYGTFQARYGMSIATDADGHARPQGSATDMGAFLASGTRNNPPTISTINPQTTNANTPTALTAFTVGDVETAAGSLTVTAASSNVAIVPNANITLGGSGGTRTISVVPAANQSGTLAIVITVSDGTTSTLGGFVLTVNPVNDPPTISPVANQTTRAGKAKGPIAFTVGDSKTSAGSLTVWATSSNTALVPNANVVLGGSGANRTVTVIPASGKAGTATITLTVSDGALTASTAFTLAVQMSGDYDGDGTTDLAYYRPSTGVWSVKQSSSNYTNSFSSAWGLSTDVPLPGDYDGDGKSDFALYRPSTGTWYIQLSSTNYTSYLAIQWGLSTDIPVPDDYDGDGKADLAVYRPSAGTWYILQSSTNDTSYLSTQWGLSTDVPVPGDYDGDGKADLGLYRPSTGVWYILQSRTNYTNYFSTLLGLSTDVAVPGDYDGDGKTDLAVYRPSSGTWYILRSSTNYTSYLLTQWGLSTDVPVPGDYDGDGKTDLAVYRPSTGLWYILRSSTNNTNYIAPTWGVATDVPVLGRLR